MNTYEKMKERLAQENQPTLENDEEYYFALGQLVRYIQVRDRATGRAWVQKLDYARRPEDQKRILSEFIRTRGKLIPLNNDRLKRTLAMVFGYVPDKPKDQENKVAYTYGCTAESIFR